VVKYDMLSIVLLCTAEVTLLVHRITGHCTYHLHTASLEQTLLTSVYVCRLLHIGRIRMDIDNPGVTWDLDKTCKASQR
jgi:hypothetical protein